MLQLLSCQGAHLYTIRGTASEPCSSQLVMTPTTTTTTTTEPKNNPEPHLPSEVEAVRQKVQAGCVFLGNLLSEYHFFGLNFHHIFNCPDIDHPTEE